MRGEPPPFRGKDLYLSTVTLETPCSKLKTAMNENQSTKSQNRGRGGHRARKRPQDGNAKISKTASQQERQRIYSECSDDHCAVCLNRLNIFAVGRCNHPGNNSIKLD